MKKPILPILAGLWPYLLVGTFLYLIWFTPEALRDVSPVLILFAVVLLGPVLGVVCLLVGLRSGAVSPAQLSGWSLAVKLAHIPFYVAVFLLTFLAVPLAAPFFLLLDIMTLCTSSGLGIAAILRARREGVVKTGWAITHCFAHCIFAADVISAFLVRKRLRIAGLPKEVFPC